MRCIVNKNLTHAKNWAIYCKDLLNIIVVGTNLLEVM